MCVVTVHAAGGVMGARSARMACELAELQGGCGIKTESAFLVCCRAKADAVAWLRDCPSASYPVALQRKGRVIS